MERNFLNDIDEISFVPVPAQALKNNIKTLAKILGKVFFIY
jgi:hypothetical protein